MSGKPVHGLSYTPEYKAWQQMRQRCTNPKHRAWKDYGGRGIKVCAYWLDSVEVFVADMGPKPSPAHELDRIDNDRGYDCGRCADCLARGVTKTNCRWTTRHRNDRNRRSNHLITHRGETLAVAEWCERLSLPSDTVIKRLAAGWDVARALETPVRPKLPNGAGRRDGRRTTKTVAAIQ